MKKFAKFIFILFLSPVLLFGQNLVPSDNLVSASNNLTQRNCSSMDVLEQQLLDDPAMEQRMKNIEQFTEDFVRTNTNTQRSVITIPVVVHVVYKTTAENISDAQIQSQIDVLNEDFRRTNSDQTNQWSQAADSEIEFCLASVDPNGNPTNGINRKKTKKRSFGADDSMKKSNRGGVNPWNTSDYLNIWVCNLGQGLLGYAQFPGGSAATDGVVCLYTAFGRVGNVNAPFNEGRTTTHEVGHWLNLRHIWGDGNCNADDFVSDTPLSDAANYGCASGHTSCSSTDMVQNYMDYSDDGCMNLFTAGQKARMQACLAGPRASLLSSNACNGGGGGPTCTDGIQNGDETGVDCGGSVCPPCQGGATCSDGIQNGDETGVDCGGSVCPPCQGGGTCDDPTNLYSQSRKGGREANLTWNASSSASSYNVRLRQVGASTWNTASTSSTSLKATNLTKNAQYEWGVQADCSGGTTSGWASSSFTAGTSSRLTPGTIGMSVYPNPANQLFTVEFNTELDEQVEIFIINVTGKLMSRTQSTGNAGYVDFNTDEFSNGIYLIKIQDTQGNTEVKKLIINK